MSATAFVLAAGFGTRLQPLTLHRPKALVPVLGQPMLGWSLALCATHGLRHVIVNAHHLAEQVQAYARRYATATGLRVDVSVERPEILGTGGGLKKVAADLAPRFAVVNADVLCDVDLAALVAAVPDGGAAMALRRQGPGEAYPVVAADETGRVVKLRELAHAPIEGEVDWTTHFTGIHALHRDALALVPDGFACIVRSAYIALVPRRQVASVRHDGRWLDVGDPAVYLRTNLELLAQPLPDFVEAAFPGGRDGQGSLVAASARVSPGARVRGSVVGAGAVVPADAEVDECVVWDGVVVPPGRHRRAIFHDGGKLVPDEGGVPGSPT